MNCIQTTGQILIVEKNDKLISAQIDLKEQLHVQDLNPIPDWLEPNTFFSAEAEIDRNGQVVKLHRLMPATYIVDRLAPTGA